MADKYEEILKFLEISLTLSASWIKESMNKHKKSISTTPIRLSRVN